MRAVGSLITCLVVTTGLIGSLLVSIDRTAYEIVDVGLADRESVGVICTFEGHPPMAVGVDEGHCDFCYGVAWTMRLLNFIG